MPSSRAPLSLGSFCDDSVKNIKAAKAIGWQTVLVGMQDRDTGARIQCAEADMHIASLRELRTVMPELFKPMA